MDIGLNRQIVLIVRSLYFSITEQWASVAKEHNLSSAQQHLLYILSSSDTQLTITEISRFGCWHISTVTRLLKPLLSEGYISIKNGKGKLKYVQLTEFGIQKLRGIAEDVFRRDHFPLNCDGIEDKTLENFAQIGLQILLNHKGTNFTHWIQYSNAKLIGMPNGAPSSATTNRLSGGA